MSLKSKKQFIKYNYGLMMLGIAILTSFFNAQNAYYFTDILGLSIGMIGICKIIHALYNGLIDTVLGYLSDKTNTKIGKRVPWLLASAPLLALTFIFVFFLKPDHGFNQVTLFLYYLIITLLFQTAASTQFVNFSSLFPNLFANNERRSASSIKQFANSMGFLIAMGGLPFFLNITNHFYLSIYIGILYLIIFLPNLFFIKENKSDLSHKNAKYSLRNNLKLFASDKPYRYVCISSVLNLATLAIIVTYYLFYFEYAMNDLNIANFILGLILVFTIISIPLWSHLIKKINYQYIWTLSSLMLSISLLTFFFIPNKYFLLIPSLTAGVAFGGTSICPDIAFAKIIDIRKEKEHVTVEGLYASTTSLFQKVFIAILPILLIPVMIIFGYKSGDSPGSHPAFLFRLIISVIPSGLIFCSFLSIRKFISLSNNN